MISRKRISGFTLFEVLVVLTLVSSIVVFLTDVLSKTLDMRGRLGQMTEQAHEVQITTSWIQNCLSNLIEDPETFEGTTKSIKGVSQMTLTSDPGVPYAFEFKLEHDVKEDITTLYYGNPELDPPVRLFAWRGNEGGFKYFNDKDEPFDRWPPELGEQAALPKTIQFEGRTAPRVGKGAPWSIEIPLIISPSSGAVNQSASPGGSTGPGGGLSGSAGNDKDQSDGPDEESDDTPKSGTDAGQSTTSTPKTSPAPAEDRQTDDDVPEKISKERAEARKLSPQEALRALLQGRGIDVGDDD